jgi:hypothetical protein
MRSFANENECSGEKATVVPTPTVLNSSAVSKSGAKDAEAPVRLEICWHDAAAQNVAILDLSGETNDHDLSVLPSPSPVANGGHPSLQTHKYL